MWKNTDHSEVHRSALETVSWLPIAGTFLTSSSFESIFFVDGSSESRIRAGIVHNVRALGTEYSQMTFQNCMTFLAQPVQGRPRLVVYDNIDDPNLNVMQLLPPGDSCALIITSRNRSIGGLHPSFHLELDVMSMQESVDLLLYHHAQLNPPTEETRKETCAIAEALGFLPIALTQARCYMYQTRCSLSEYFGRLSTSRDKLLAHPVKYQRDMRYLSTYAAFDASFNKLSLRDQMAIQLLSCLHSNKFPLELIAFAATFDFSQYWSPYLPHGDELYTGKAVLEEIFCQDGKWSATILDEIVVSLQNYSLVSILPGVDTRLVQMHPLAHDWIHSYISGADLHKYEAAAVLLLALAAREYPPFWAQYLPSHITHLSHLLDHLHINDVGAWGRLLAYCGLLEDALRLQNKVVTDLKRLVSPDDPSLPDSLWALATTYCDTGRLPEAEVLLVEVVRRMKEIHGVRHTKSIGASAVLARVYSNWNRLEDARVIQEEVLKLQKEVLGPNDLHTMVASYDLAIIYGHLGMQKEAKPLREESLKGIQAQLGDRHVYTLTLSWNLAWTHSALGQPYKTKELLEQLLKLFKEVMGPSHPGTIPRHASLAQCYLNLQMYAEAKDLLEEALRLGRQVLGELHPNTIPAMLIPAMLALAQYYEERHEAPRALELIRAVESAIFKTLGKTHPQYKRLQLIKWWYWYRRVDPPPLKGFVCICYVLLCLWLGARYIIGELSLFD